MTNATVDLMKVHCSVRAYEDKIVSEDVRKAILEAAFAASSSSFLQLVTVIRVTDAAKRQAFYELSGNQKHVLTDPNSGCSARTCTEMLNWWREPTSAGRSN